MAGSAACGWPVAPEGAACFSNFSICRCNCRNCSSICNICFFKSSSSDAFSCAKTAGANGPRPSANTTRSASARDPTFIQTPHVPVGKAPPAAEVSRSSTAQRLGYGLRGSERAGRSEEHTSELQSRLHLVCRLLLEKKKH